MQLGHERRWLEATKAWKEGSDLQPMEMLLEEIEAMGYSATQDTPMNFLATALIKLRPQRQGFCTAARDSAEEWYDSYVFIVEFTLRLQHGRPWKYVFPQISSWVRPILSLLLPLDHPEKAIKPSFDRASSHGMIG